MGHVRGTTITSDDRSTTTLLYEMLPHETLPALTYYAPRGARLGLAACFPLASLTAHACT